MIKKRPEYLKSLILAFIIGTTLFIAIFGIANYVSYSAYQRTSTQTNIIERQIGELSDFLNESNCENDLLFESSRRLDDAGSKIGLIEREFGKNDKRVLEQKKLYTELEYNHFKIVKKINERCREDYDIIFFFYSNKKDYEDSSEEMGYILTIFKMQNPEKTMVYSFDYELESEIISKLKEDYLISDVPLVIINENVTLKIKNIGDLNKYLRKE